MREERLRAKKENSNHGSAAQHSSLAWSASGLNGKREHYSVHSQMADKIHIAVIYSFCLQLFHIERPSALLLPTPWRGPLCAAPARSPALPLWPARERSTSARTPFNTPFSLDFALAVFSSRRRSARRSLRGQRKLG